MAEVTSGDVYTSSWEGSNGKRRLCLHWKIDSVDEVNLTTTIKYKIYGDGSYDGYVKCGPVTVIINGHEKTFNSRKDIYGGTIYKEDQLETIKHNTDGTKTFTIEIKAAIYSASINKSGSQTFTLPPLPVPARIINAPDFTDEDNPTITYTNNAKYKATTLQACISFTGANPDIAYRNISKTGSTYTFNLTDAERRILRAGTSGKSRTVKFYIKTVMNGLTYYTSTTKTYSITNGNPEISPTVIDTDIETIALTGNSDRLIKYFSDAKFTINAKAIKESILKTQKVECGGKSATTATGTLQNVESGTFIFTATDSRGFTTTHTVKKTIVEYVKLTCNVEASTPTAAGTMTLTIKGNYFNAGFGAANNVLIVHYRMKKDDGEYGEWIAANATLKGNTYSLSITISDLNYQSKYTFQARAADMLMTVDSAEKSVKSTPVFDWSKNDFNFNVPVAFNAPVALNAGYTAHNILLWQGVNYMTANQTVNLTQSIQSQPHGIVLVFSNYDAANSKANDYDWHCYFVPKYLVDIKEGTGHCFNMMSQSFGDIASKYIYISDTYLKGDDNNTTNGTRNGITYNNSKYVLRYVFGV